ncbi:MAG TPA: protein kinase, partial [Acidimicrobiia bacterium]|nr:protein kinase [Acidimicrobiia bacterium]
DRERLQTAVGDSYRVGRRIGQGQVSATFRAIRAGKHTEVALKLLDIDGSARPDLVQRLAELAHRIMGLVWDTAVVPVTLEQYGSTVLLAMPFIETGSVATVLAAGERLPVNRILELVSQVAEALDELQDRGLCHRGLTPDNILLGREDKACLTDVGVTDLILAESGAYGARLSKARAYAAPEQRRGKHVDGRADQYSLAVIAYELFTGRQRVGFDSVEGIDTVAPIEVLADAPLRKDLPLYANLALRRALSASPANRFPTSTAFAEALTGVAPTTLAGLPTKRARLELTRRRRVFAAFGTLMVVLGLAVVIDAPFRAGIRDAWRSVAGRFSVPSARVDLNVTPATGAPTSTPASAPPNRSGANQPLSSAAPGSASRASRAGAQQPGNGGTPTASTPATKPKAPVTVHLGPSSSAPTSTDTTRAKGDALASGKGALKGAQSWFSRVMSRILPGNAAPGSYVRVTVDGGTALVAIDGIPRGATPLVASVGAGHHTVTIIGSGSYDATSLGVTASPGDTTLAAFHAAAKR